MFVSVVSARRADGDGATEEEAEFNWEEYLEETGGEAAPHTAFKHVRPAPLNPRPSIRPSRRPGDPLNTALARSAVAPP